MPPTIVEIDPSKSKGKRFKRLFKREKSSKPLEEGRTIYRSEVEAQQALNEEMKAYRRARIEAAAVTAQAFVELHQQPKTPEPQVAQPSVSQPQVAEPVAGPSANAENPAVKPAEDEIQVA